MFDKYLKLDEIISEYAKEDVAVAFSGGVDSSLLLYMMANAVKQTGKPITAYIIASSMHPLRETREAEKYALEMGAEVVKITLDEMSEAGIENNPKDRCYRCKKTMFSKIIKDMKSRGISILIEGTNADDLKVYRPGIKAVRELGVKSPLADVGLVKDEIRNLAREFSIEANKKPSTPCMATRFPYNTKLVPELLSRVNDMEEYIRSLGFYNVRCRASGKSIRIEVDKNDVIKVLNYSDEITEYIKSKGYRYVSVDLEGFRSGSYDD